MQVLNKRLKKCMKVIGKCMKVHVTWRGTTSCSCLVFSGMYVKYVVEVIRRRGRVGGACLRGVKRCPAIRVQTTCSGTCAVVGHSSRPGAEQWTSVANDCQPGTRSRLTLVKAPWRINEPEYCKEYRPVVEVRQLLSVAPIMRPAT